MPVVFLFTFFLRANAQETYLQSLFTKLRKAPNDHERAKIYYSISHYYWAVNKDSALLMGNRSLELAQRIGDDTAVALAYLTLGVAYAGKELYPQALDFDLKSLRWSEKAGMEGLTGNNFTNIGIVYTGMGEFREAAKYFRRALDISLRDKKDSTHAGMAIGYINMGDVYWQQGFYDSAIFYGRLALPIVDRLADPGYLAITLSNMGRGFSRLRLPDSALAYAGRARVFFIRQGDSASLAEADNTLAEAWHLQGKDALSVGSAQEALRLAEISHDHEIALDACKTLAAGYEALGNYKAAAVYLHKELILRDSVFTLAKEKQIRSLQSGYDLEKKQQEIVLLEKENALRKSKEELNRDILIILSISLALLSVACAFLYRGMVQKRAQNEQLESLNAVKNKLFSIIGHDLRSPIATLNGFVTLLHQSALTPEKIAWFTGKIQESLSATAHLLDNLLFWAKSQMQGMEVDREAFDLAPLLDQNRQLAQLRAEGKKITIVLELPPGAVPDVAPGVAPDVVPDVVPGAVAGVAPDVGPDVVAGVAPGAVPDVIADRKDAAAMDVIADKNMVDLVLRNLLENAIKFSFEGGVVTLGVAPRGAEWEVFVKDSGKGMSPADQAKIGRGSLSFSTAGTGKEKGSGLGLFLCRELVEKNGGRFWFESEEDKGSTFYFALPAK